MSAPKAEAKPAKKVEEKEVNLEMLLGRPTNSVSIGLVGLPNVGKSSLFNLLGTLQVPAENYPFCTIKPATCTVPVPDDRFDYLQTHWKPKSRIQAVLTVTDIAGLVKGAAEGKGLGNEFLANIQAVDAIYHVLRAFADKDIEHVEGDVDPIRDITIITEELIKKDLATMEVHVAQAEKKLRAAAKTPGVKEEVDTVKKIHALLAEGKEIRHGEWGVKEIPIVNSFNLLTAKPCVYLVNVSEKNYTEGKNKWMQPLKQHLNKVSPGSPVIPFSATFEAKLKPMSDEEKKKVLDEYKVPTAVPRIILSGYKALHLIHYFTCGEDEVRCWSIRKGTKAPAAAGVIHGDFEKGFICAEIYNFDDFKEHGSEAGVKAAGKYRSQGKEYVVKDGDICFFKHGKVAAPAKKKT